MTNDGTTIVPSEVVAPLDSSGAMSVNLAANDDTDTIPADVQWEVTLRILGSDPISAFITIPSAGSGNVDLGGLMPGAPQVN